MSTVNEKMTALADEVRELSGTTDLKGIDEMTQEVEGANIVVNNQSSLIIQIKSVVDNLPEAGPGDGTDTSDANATVDDILEKKTAYVNGEKLEGNIPLKTSSDLINGGNQIIIPAGCYKSNIVTSVDKGSVKLPKTSITINPTISVSDTGMVRSSVEGSQSITPNVSAGYVSKVESANVIVQGTANLQLDTYSGGTVTPMFYNHVIPKFTYLTEDLVILGDENLVPQNIVKGKSIFGVNGSYEGSGGGGSESRQLCYATITGSYNAAFPLINFYEGETWIDYENNWFNAQLGPDGELHPYIMTDTDAEVVIVVFCDRDSGMTNAILMDVVPSDPIQHEGLYVLS